jgi:hypothetical protein
MLANWLLVWVVLANIGFSLMYFVGSPPRVTSIVMFGGIGLMVRGMRFEVQVIAFLAALAYAVFTILGALFNLPILSLSQSVRFMGELNAFNSVEYVGIGLFLIALVIAAGWALRRPAKFRDQRAVFLAIAAVGLVAASDVYMGYGMRGHYKRVNPDGAPFTSAVTGSGLLPAAADAPRRNVMIVMVESLGAPVDNPELSRMIFARYNDSAIKARFDVSGGTTTYYGSTTSGEVRELCGRWGDYYDLLDRRDGGCLPARMAKQGYETAAYHSFSGDFFERNTWYPNIGFQKMGFRDYLLKGGAEHCGGVFPGVCDRDVPRQLAQKLKAADKPQFIYWLTVNSHLPVPEKNNLNTDNCARVSPRLAKDFPLICRQVAIWDDIDKAMVKEITAADFPPTDILIVGDHMPPYFDSAARKQFAPDRVPWLLLKWRGD